MLLQEKYPPKPRIKSENIHDKKTTMSPRTETSDVVAVRTKGIIEVKVLGSDENLSLILEKTRKFYIYSRKRQNRI